jgi:hypothetical protein
MVASVTTQRVCRAPFERETLLDAFLPNPGMRWTPEGVSSWYGIRNDAVRALLDQFMEIGIVHRAPGRGNGHVLNEEPFATVRPLSRRSSSAHGAT